MKLLIYLLFAFSIMLSGCGSDKAASHDTENKIKKTDGFSIQNYDSDMKEHTYYYKRHPQRIVSLWQNSLETLIALGAADKIVAAGGIANEKYLKPEHLDAYHKIPVRNRQVFSQEDVLLMKPDFILGWLFDFSGKGRSIGTTDFWEKRNVNIYMNLMNGAEFKSKHVLEDEIKYILDVGKITDTERRAAEIVNGIYTTVKECKAAVKKEGRPPRVLIVAGLGKIISIYTPRTLPGDIVTKLGGDVLGKHKETIGENEYMSMEEIRVSDPDVVFISTVPEMYELSTQKFCNLPGFQNLRCVKNKKVFCIPYYTIRSPGVLVRDAVTVFSEGLQKGR